MLLISATRMKTVGSRMPSGTHTMSSGSAWRGSVGRAHMDTRCGAQPGEHRAVKVAAYLALEAGGRRRDGQLVQHPHAAWNPLRIVQSCRCKLERVLVVQTEQHNESHGRQSPASGAVSLRFGGSACWCVDVDEEIEAIDD